MAETKIGNRGAALLAVVALAGGGALILWQATKANAEELPPPEEPALSAITAAIEPAGSGKVVVHGGVLPQIGDRVTIEAIPNPGWLFSHWQWDNGSIFSQNPFTVVVTREAWLIANFIPAG